MGVKKSALCRSRPPPNGMKPASSRVCIPLTKPFRDSGASPTSTCSRSPGANLDAQPAFVEYFVSLMRVRSSIAAEYNPVSRQSVNTQSLSDGPHERHIFSICRSAYSAAADECHIAPKGKVRLRRGLDLRPVYGHLGQSEPVVQPATRIFEALWPV